MQITPLDTPNQLLKSNVVLHYKSGMHKTRKVSIASPQNKRQGEDVIGLKECLNKLNESRMEAEKEE